MENHFLYVAFLVVVGLVLSQSEREEGETINRDEWIDPGDMLNYSPGHVEPPAQFDKNQDKSVLDKFTTHVSSARQLANEYYNKLKSVLKGVPADVVLEEAFANLQRELSLCHRDFEKTKTHLKTCRERIENSGIPSCDTPYFKQLARRLLESIEKHGDHDVVVKLSHDGLETLKNFVNSEKGNVQDASEVIFNVLSNVKVPSFEVQKSPWQFLWQFLNRAVIGIILLAIIAFGSLIVLQIKVNISWRRQAGSMFIACFLLSIPWEWFRLYRIEFANKQAQILKDVPKHCQPDHTLSFAESLKLWGTYMFTVSDDACAKYQEAFLVDPLWEVTPARAVSVTITRFFVQPLEYIAEAAGKSFRALFKEVPVQWQPIMFLSIVIITILFLFFMTGVQVRLPFLTIGTAPAPVQPGRIDANIGRIEDQITDIANRLEQLRNQQTAIQEALPEENNPDEIRQGFERMAQLMAAANERDNRRENEIRYLKELLTRTLNKALPAGGEGQHGATAVARPATRREREDNSWEVVEGESGSLENAIGEERRPRGGPVENTVPGRPAQETEHPAESIGSNTSYLAD